MVSEVISRVERRRHWPTAEKLRILSEALAPGATVAGVSDRNGVCRSQIYAWLRLARSGRLPGISVSPQAGHFVPARIEAFQNPSASGCQPGLPAPACDTGSMVPSRGRRPKTVEVLLANGRIMRVDECIDPDALARLVTALEGGRSC
jgi:transposase